MAAELVVVGKEVELVLVSVEVAAKEAAKVEATVVEREAAMVVVATEASVAAVCIRRNRQQTIGCDLGILVLMMSQQTARQHNHTWSERRTAHLGSLVDLLTSEDLLGCQPMSLVW